MKILVLGGYGVFGGRISRLLLEDGFDVTVAGRSINKARAFTAEYGGRPLQLDTSDTASLVEALKDKQVVIDAIGPFQAYGSAPIAELAIEKGCHYLDISDDAEFTLGIASLDAAAKEANVMVLSGVSTVPAISSVVVADLCEGLADVALIDTAILPGNRAPRGRAVMDAILSQVGRPLKQWRGGAWVSTPAWSGSVKRALPRDLSRPASPIGAPDLSLFPDRFKARSVLFRAGLELGVMHHGLRAFGWAHRKGILPRLDRLTWPMLQAARMLSPFGSDQGGMSVTVAGRDHTGLPKTRGWRLHMSQGKGPFVPSIPALLVARHIAAGTVEAGARPALGCFTPSELEAALKNLTGVIDGDVEDRTPLFEHAIGTETWSKMPSSYRAAHDLWDMHVMSGTSRVERGTSFLARSIAALFRFPPANEAVPVSVTMERIGEAEHWTRDFDGQTFKSVLTYKGPGRLQERFGPFAFELDLPIKEGQMQMNVVRGWCAGIPLPKFCLPISDTSEFEADGVFRFDVKLSLPWVGMIVRYQGELRRKDLDHSAASLGGSDGFLSFG